MPIEYAVEKAGVLKDPPDKFSRQMKKNVSTAVNDVLRPAQDMVRGPIPKGASGLFQSIKLKRATIASPEATINSTHWLLELVEEKTSAHVIRPRGSVSDMVAGTAHKALRFKVKGKMIFATKVNHPGTKGKYSWKAGYEFVEATLQTSIQQAVEAALAGQDYSSGPKVYSNRSTPIPVRV